MGASPASGVGLLGNFRHRTILSHDSSDCTHRRSDPTRLHNSFQKILYSVHYECNTVIPDIAPDVFSPTYRTRAVIFF